MDKYFYYVLLIGWIFLGITLLWYEGYKMFHILSKKDKKYDWILYVFLMILSGLLIIY